MKRYLFITAMGLLSFVNSQAQTTELSPNVTARMEQLLQVPTADLVSDIDYKLPWDTAWERDIVWKRRVWRVIDANMEGNEVFKPQSVATNQLFVNMLRGVMAGKIKAYDARDDRFTQELTTDGVKEQLKARFAKPEKIAVTRYMIKEEWLYTNEGKIQVRIIGIAPLVAGATGADEALFWLFYPAGRAYMASCKAIGAENWDEIMEKRHFKSKIVKEGETDMRKRYVKETGK